MTKKEQLKEIEKDIQPLFRNPKRTWVMIYELLQKVENQLLYTDDYNSYTAWITHLSKQYNITLSLLWKYKKAGKFYQNYVHYYTLQNINVPILEKSGYAPEVLVMIEKITAGNMREAYRLLNKNYTGNITRNDLKIMWNSTKAEREKQGLPINRINAHDEEKFENMSYKNYNISQTSFLDIVTALCDHKWLYSSKLRQNHFVLTTPILLSDSYIRPSNRSLTENSKTSACAVAEYSSIIYSITSRRDHRTTIS